MRSPLPRPVHRAVPSTVVLLAAFFSSFLLIPAPVRAEGERGTVAEPGGYHPSHPVMDTLARAGVVGGIPEISNVKAELWPGADIQAAIDNGGPGVVYLHSGGYDLWEPLYLKDGVVLRGEHRNNVWISVKFRSTWKQFAVRFGRDCSYAGLENLTVSYDAVWQDPIDRWGLDNGGYYWDAFQNNPHGYNDLYVGLVELAGTCNWLDTIDLKSSGTDPVLLNGWHNTVRNSYIDRCYNKGDGGNGYFDLRGDLNLVADNWILRLRHFAIQQGARHNVVRNNRIDVDVNFHNGDDGQNLVEYNEINRPSWHPWTLWGTGASQYGHAPPGYGNILFRNTCWDYDQWYAPTATWNSTYTFWGYGQPGGTNWPVPYWGKYYSIKYLPSPWSGGDIGGGDQTGFATESNGTWTIQADGADVWNQWDDFYYAWQPLYGDGEIIAEVQSQPWAHDWAKAGLMVRENLDGGSKHAMVCVTPANGTSFQYRSSGGGSSAAITPGDGQTAPSWLRLTRVEDTLSGYVWQDDAWVLVGSVDISMWYQAQVGFFVSSHDASNPTTVQFGSVAASALVTPDKTEYGSGEPVAVRFGQGAGNATDWIGIYADGDVPGSGASKAWYYINNTQSPSWATHGGTVVFDTGAGPVWPLPAGDYFTVLFEDDGYTELSPRAYFSVTPAGP